MVNVATVALFGYDKYQATRMLPESSERTLDWGGVPAPTPACAGDAFTLAQMGMCWRVLFGEWRKRGTQAETWFVEGSPF